MCLLTLAFGVKHGASFHDRSRSFMVDTRCKCYLRVNYHLTHVGLGFMLLVNVNQLGIDTRCLGADSPNHLELTMVLHFMVDLDPTW
jgi:hypothetical protein